MTSRLVAGGLFVWVAVQTALTVPAVAQGGGSARRLAVSSTQNMRPADALVDSLQRSGELRVRQHRTDTLKAGREHDHLDQYYNGVRVFGGDVARQTERGITVSLFGTVYEGIELDTNPGLSADEARGAIERAAGAPMRPGVNPELVVLPRVSGGYDLAYRGRVLSEDGLFIYFVGARSGAVLLQFNDLKTQHAIGAGTGVLGDSKKVSVTKDSGSYRASDGLRPPALRTFDLRGNATRTMMFLTGRTALVTGDLASDNDNVWTDGAVVDAQAYAGFVYDFYYKRFGRRGLDNADIPITNLVHPANRDDVLRQSNSVIGLLYLNAAYFGEGVMVYGEGLPSMLTDGDGHHWNFMSGALDVIAHELTHGVTEYSSQLIYLNESGALNEAFSDIMGTAVEFAYQPKGDGLLKADYLMGEDVVTPGGLRSLENPGTFGDPDHFTKRYLGPQDNGGVHTNATIVTHAFYLAIEGGANRTSHLSVAGVGAANRQQIENLFYRAFTQLMPSGANFSVARAATIQSARDLYGAGSAAERAVTEAWTAVGVN
jgi:bacillolysin